MTKQSDQTEKPKFGFLAWCGTIFFGFALLIQAYHGLQYVFDSNYRHQRQTEEQDRENQRLQRRALENQVRWKLNGCDLPDTCDWGGNRLDGDVSGGVAAREFMNNVK